MKLKRVLKEGFIIMGVFAIVTIGMLLTADRIERLEKNSDCQSIKISK